MARHFTVIAFFLLLLAAIPATCKAGNSVMKLEVYAGKVLSAKAEGEATYADTTIDFSSNLSSPATLGFRFDGVFPDTRRGLYLDVFILPMESSRVSSVMGALSMGGSLPMGNRSDALCGRPLWKIGAGFIIGGQSMNVKKDGTPLQENVRGDNGVVWGLEVWVGREFLGEGGAGPNLRLKFMHLNMSFDAKQNSFVPFEPDEKASMYVDAVALNAGYIF